MHLTVCENGGVDTIEDRFDHRVDCGIHIGLTGLLAQYCVEAEGIYASIGEGPVGRDENGARILAQVDTVFVAGK